MQQTIRNVLFCAGVLASVYAGAPLALAQYAPGGGIPGVAGNGAGNAAVAAARTELAIAQANVDRLKEAALRKLESNPAWVAAQQAQGKAADDLDAAKERARLAARGSEAYRSLQARRASVSSSTQRDELQASLLAMEAEAVLKSPEVREARERKSGAESEVANRWAQYESDVLARDPQWLEAVAARDDARTRFAAASASQASASRSTGTGRSSSGYAGRSSRGRSSGRRGYR